MDIERASRHEIILNARLRLMNAYRNSEGHCRGQAKSYAAMSDRRREEKYLAKANTFRALAEAVASGKLDICWKE